MAVSAVATSEHVEVSTCDRLLLDCASRHPILDSRCCTDSLILHFCGRITQVDTPEAKGATELLMSTRAFV
jgi:hypothetical protein